MTNYEKYKSALDSILPTVEKPARYTGGEWNATHKPAETVTTRLALCFPDTYEIGMSHLGLKILYSLLNNREGWQAERVYAPWPDMEARLRERHLRTRFHLPRQSLDLGLDSFGPLPLPAAVVVERGSQEEMVAVVPADSFDQRG